MMREKCRVTGKDIYESKADARSAANALRVVRKGRGTTQRCAFGDHWHVTKGLLGRKGKGDFR